MRHLRRGIRAHVWVLAASLTLSVAGCGGGKTVSHAGGDATPSHGRPHISPSHTAQATSPGQGNGCGLTDTNQTPPTSTPKDVTWQLIKGDALPASPSAGPGKIEGPIARCYAHTPLGALIAASQIGDRLGLASNREAIQILKQQAIPGPGVDNDLRMLAGPEMGDGSSDGQLAGFQFVDYTPDTAVINLANRMNNGTFNVATFTVKWLDGDWKIQIQASGADSSSVSQVASLAGYVTWSGTN